MKIFFTRRNLNYFLVVQQFYGTNVSEKHILERFHKAVDKPHTYKEVGIRFHPPGKIKTSLDDIKFLLEETLKGLKILLIFTDEGCRILQIGKRNKIFVMNKSEVDIHLTQIRNAIVSNNDISSFDIASSLHPYEKELSILV